MTVGEYFSWTLYELHSYFIKPPLPHSSSSRLANNAVHIQRVMCPSHGHGYPCEAGSHLCQTCQSPEKF